MPNDIYKQCKECIHKHNMMVCNSCTQEEPSNYEEE
jgi:hypothetical protein